MSDLKQVDLYKLESILGMSSGYVLNFSNNSFAQFIAGSIGINPYDEKYNYGDSKANRLRGVLREEDNEKVGTLIIDLVELWYSERLRLKEIDENIEKTYEICLKIGKKLKSHKSFKTIESESVNKLNHSFINEQIEKCNNKIKNNDFNGAITNARTLLEAIMIEIIKETGEEIINDGKINKLFTKVKNILNLENRSDYPFAITQILEGIDKITSGLTDLSNKVGDRHTNDFKTHKHHAKLAVNACMTLVDFLLDSREYQKIKEI